MATSGADETSLADAVSALTEIAIREGHFEFLRAQGNRGSLRLNVELVLGDNGVPLYSVSALSFEGKRHIKDGFIAREKPNDSTR